ncbi:mycothiol system anti-sigma-R factor [Flexivirga sp. ID2601S]|uniref:Mycothiol system anti-sigma-R factor n=1 Tax=Flexivirga aerilata TaxID=1656889 RepID=A0A849AJ20_9MICO|nr:mycothiol system anti-sigma-R factor [Flexivirga aerilata]NNG39248.1 mycothiol system anti-sigma-R factor [Flexivirga aerilata]
MGAECSDYVSRIFQYLDGELDDEGRARLKEHLDGCPPCLDEYELDALLKALVRRSCACEQAPDALRAQILTRITSVQVTTVRVREA